MDKPNAKEPAKRDNIGANEPRTMNDRHSQLLYTREIPDPRFLNPTSPGGAGASPLLLSRSSKRSRTAKLAYHSRYTTAGHPYITKMAPKEPQVAHIEGYHTERGSVKPDTRKEGRPGFTTSRPRRSLNQHRTAPRGSERSGEGGPKLFKRRASR